MKILSTLLMTFCFFTSIIAQEDPEMEKSEDTSPACLFCDKIIAPDDGKVCKHF